MPFNYWIIVEISGEFFFVAFNQISCVFRFGSTNPAPFCEWLEWSAYLNTIFSKSCAKFPCFNTGFNIGEIFISSYIV